MGVGVKTILVVDDTPANIDIVKAILLSEHTVKAAVSGQMALKIIEKDVPDLILLDIMMPEMDGYEVCRRLKENEATWDIPIIFLTAKTQAEDETMGFELGAVDYITKPISSAILAARVNTHLALSEARRTLAEQNQALIEAARMMQDVEHIMRHDLKSALTVIIGFPPLLLMDDSLREQQRKFIKSIGDAGSRMLNMIDISLDILKMEYGTYEPDFKVVDILAIIEKVLEEQCSLSGSKDIGIVILVDGQPVGTDDKVEINNEERLLHSVLGNLVKNAVEAAPKGDAITISLATVGILSLMIENGGEVPPTIRDTFFDKFVTAGKKDGTGLGTYSARLIIETLGGTISLDSSIPGRTRVCVTLSRDGDSV